MITAYTIYCLNILLLHALYFIYDSVEDPSSFQNYIRMEQYVLEELLELITIHSRIYHILHELHLTHYRSWCLKH